MPEYGQIDDISRMTMQPDPFELPAVRLAPPDELAAAVRRCDTLRSVRQLAEWVGRRKVTKAGNLTLADARRAVQELRLPGDQGEGRTIARNSAGFPELHELWQLAVELRFLDTGYGQVQPGPALEAISRDHDDDLIGIWTDLLAATLEPLLVSPGLAAVVVPVVSRLYVDAGPVPLDELALEALAGPADVELDEVRSDPMAMTLARGYDPAVRSLLDDLGAIDAATVDGDQAELTDLGRRGLSEWFEDGGVRAPTVTDLAEASAEDLLDLGLVLDGPEQLDALFDEWVTARGAGQAAHDLLEFARGGLPVHRVTAFGLLDRIDGVAEASVRAALTDASVRPHAQAWLAGRGAVDVSPTLDDLQRLFIDVIAADLDDEASLRASIIAIASDNDPAHRKLIGELWRCDHADTVDVLGALERHHPAADVVEAARKAAMRARTQVSPDEAEDRPSKPGATRRTTGSGTAAGAASTYQLKVTLQHTKPPIWRRVLVPGSITLPELHEVIQVAMGWTDSHLHEFEIAGVRYGSPADGMPEYVECELGVRLDEVAGESSRLGYTYDFGNDWTHEVMVEKVLPAESGKAVAVCLAGRRACPPEDIGGPWSYLQFLEAYDDPAHEDHQHYREWVGEGFDPAAFDADQVTKRLRRLK